MENEADLNAAIERVRLAGIACAKAEREMQEALAELKRMALAQKEAE